MYEQPDNPAVPGFRSAAEAQSHYVLSRIEHHARIIKGWVIFFGICAVITLVFMAFAMAAAYNDYNRY